MSVLTYFPPLNKGGKKAWLNFIPYAKQLFGETGDEIWENSGRFLSMFSQAQGLLKSDVLSIPVFDFYKVYQKSHPEITDQWKGKKTTFSLRKLLSLDEPRGILMEVIEGINSLYCDRFPLVLEIPSPYQWMLWLKETEYSDGELAVSINEIDSATMYLADFLRNFSQAGLAGIVLNEANSFSLKPMEAQELYQTIFNIAKHYQWALGVHFEERHDLGELVVDVENVKEKVDFVLYDGGRLHVMDVFSEAGIACGGGLDNKFWIGESSLGQLSEKDLAFGKIPEDANPEKVIERLQELRSLSL